VGSSKLRRPQVSLCCRWLFRCLSCARIVVAHRSHRVSSRVLLAFGLAVVSGGLFWMGREAPRFDYSAMLGGMLMTGLGAGVLNGEVVKVGMSVIPPERAGMASGISGTVRFSGIAVGFAVLGAILFARISSTVMTGLPDASASERISETLPPETCPAGSPVPSRTQHSKLWPCTASAMDIERSCLQRLHSLLFPPFLAGS
jgi:hypothetical protein